MRRFARPGSFATGRTELSSSIGQDKIKKRGRKGLFFLFGTP